MTFTMIGDRLGLCCPDGRAVTLDDLPLAWMVQERQRADAGVNALMPSANAPMPPKPV